MATRNATNRSEFEAAIAASVSGDIIFVPGENTIDLTGRTSTINVPAGVEIRGERGKLASGTGPGGRSLGGRILRGASAINASFHLLTMGTGSKIRFMRVEGPSGTTSGGPTGVYPAGIRVTTNGVLVEWCEIYNFPYAGINTSYTNLSWRLNVNRCFIHNNQRSGLGYGITNTHGWFIVTDTTFQSNRHAISGSGDATCSFEARRCTVLDPNNSSDAHQFDMHQDSGQQDNRANPQPAGGTMIVEDCYFQPVNFCSFEIRGIPRVLARVANCKFRNPVLSGGGAYQNGEALDFFGGETNNSYTQITGNTVNYQGPWPRPDDTDLFWGPPVTPPSTVTCTLTAPANGTVYEAPASIGLTATASSSGGSITSVVFKNGSTILGNGNLSGAVYSYSYSAVPAGSYNFTATATDSVGTIGNSATISVVVQVAPPPPTVTNGGWGFSRKGYIMDKLANFIKRAPYLFKK